MKLYNYQWDLLEKVDEAFECGHRSPCLVAPCGSGKSVMIAEVIKNETDAGNRVLFLVHRDELLSQIEETLKAHAVNMSLVSLGMVLTIANRLDGMQCPELIVTDECHHGTANSYTKIYEHFPHARRLSFTATPIRLSGEGLGRVNDVLILGPTVEWLINNNRLSPFRYFSLGSFDRNSLKLKAGDFTNASITSSMLHDEVFQSAVDNYKKYADGEQAIIYCHSVQISEIVAHKFSDNGITAVHMDSDTKPKARAEIVNKFRTGEINAICNVDLIGEGFDVPDCSTVILLRPTKSLSVFIQQSMRGMRYRPSKTSIILDLVGNVHEHGLPDEERSWSLEDKVKSGDGESPVRTCMGCYCTFHISLMECPECGLEVPPKEVEEAKVEPLQEIVRRKFGKLHDYIEYGKEKNHKRIAPYLRWVERDRGKRLIDLEIEDCKEIAEMLGMHHGWIKHQREKESKQTHKTYTRGN